MNTDKKERLLELLADQAIFGLSEEELIELGKLKNQFPDWEDEFAFEEAAATIALSNVDVQETLPVNLRKNILADAEQFFGSAEETQNVFGFAPETKSSGGALATETNVVESTPKTPFWQWLGWGLATAACVALAFNIWFTRLQPTQEIAKTPPPPTATPTPELTLEQKRQQFLASANDLVKTEWTSPNKEEQISGDIVWSDSAQQGYMRFRGLRVNNQQKETYQLWIFDETQDEKTPIDGGIFDVSEQGEVIVPIDPKLKVRNPKMFAVTVEKPGGVVVSKREKIAAIAKVET